MSEKTPDWVFTVLMLLMAVGTGVWVGYCLGIASTWR